MRVILLYEGMLHRGLAAANRLTAYGQALLIEKVDVTMIVPFAFKARDEMPNNKTGNLKGVPYNYLYYIPFHPRQKSPLIVAAGILFISKIYGYLKLLFLLLFFRKKYDVVFVYEFKVFYSFLVRLASWGKPLVFEMCEIPNFGVKEVEERIRKRKRRERWNYQYAQGFIVISENLNSYINNLNLRRRMSIVQIPILSTNQNIDQKALNKDIVNKWKKPYIVHTGSITQNKDGILTILKGIGEYNKKYLSAPLNFYCSGVLEESMVYSEIIKLLEIYKLQNNVFFTGYLSDAELENLLINSLLSVVYKVSNEQNKYCFPTKIASYLSYGIPLIVTNVGPMGDEFTNNNNALVIKEGCTESLVEAVFRIANDEELRNDLSRNGLKLLRDRYSIVANSKRMKVFFTDLINVD